MLIRGLRHYNARSYRQSLFDTSTAVEMALTELLDKKLTTINPQQKKNLMKESQQLSGLTRALRMTGETVSPDIKSKVGAPRNKAMHEGRETEEVHAREALAAARSFIETKLPLV